MDIRIKTFWFFKAKPNNLHRNQFNNLCNPSFYMSCLMNSDIPQAHVYGTYHILFPGKIQNKSKNQNVTFGNISPMKGIMVSYAL